MTTIKTSDLEVVTGGFTGLLGGIEDGNAYEYACNQLKAAKDEAARRGPHDKQAQDWVKYKRQFCGFNVFDSRSW